MKYISLSFDDGRADTYDVAYKIMNKYGIKATVNVVSDYINHPKKYKDFFSKSNSMTKKKLLEWQKSGNEIACHGSTHNNSDIDVLKNIKELTKMGIDTKNIGFASPHSYLTKKNIEATGIDKLQKEGILSYVRSGIKVRREGLLYTVLAFIEQLTHSKRMHYLLNKRNIINKKIVPQILPSSVVKSFTTLKQMQYFIEKLNSGDSAIFMFHSILYPSDKGYGIAHYYWDADKFEKFCVYLSKKSDVKVLTTHELLNKLKKDCKGV